jgi:hypothetical protein
MVTILLLLSQNSPERTVENHENPMMVILWAKNYCNRYEAEMLALIWLKLFD